MRITVSFEEEKGSLNLPIHYNHLVQSFIYSSLDELTAKFYHEKGYTFGKRKFKLFTFSRILGKEREVKNKDIIFKGPVKLKIGAMEEDILESFATHIVKKSEFYLGKNKCYLISIEVEMPVEAKSPVVVRTLSPITISKTLYDLEGKKKRYYFSPFEKDFQKEIINNLLRKAKAYFGEDIPSIEGSFIKPLKVSKRNLSIVNFKGTWIEGWTGIYELNLPKPYFELAYNAGLGSKNSQGFGMVEVVKKGGNYDQNTY